MDNNENDPKKITLEQTREIPAIDTLARQISDMSKSGQVEEAYAKVAEMVAQVRSFSSFQSDLLGWTIFRFLKSELAKPSASFSVVRNALATYCRLNVARPSLLHSVILYQAVQTEKIFTKEFKFTGFMKVWGLGNFRQEDWDDFKGDKHTAPSLVKNAISKYVAELKDDSIPAEAIDPDYVSLLDNAIKKYPSWPLGKLYKARLFSAQGKKTEAIAMLKNLAATAGQAYVFKEIADLSSDIDTKIASYCRYVVEQERAGQDTLIGKARIQLAQLLIEKKRFAEAMTELAKYHKTASEQKRRITDDYYLAKARIPEGVEPMQSNAELYRESNQMVDRFIFGDVAETPILVTHINKEHCSLTFVTSDRQTGYLKKTPKGMKLNGCYMVKFAELNIKRPSKTISFREASAEEARTAGLMVTATGKLSLALGGFGFVKNGSDDIFVPQKIAENSGNGDSVTVNAVLSYNHKRQSWGFTAISLRRDE